MKAVGLVTEYNPFHNGHKYHIDEAKRITGADYAIAVMSGDFVQRGTPAVIDKYRRTEMALRNGIDLVLELPVCYATGSAEFFAYGAVSLLDKLGVVDYLCFGSECGDIELLREAAQFLINPPKTYEDRLQALLKNGLTYPAARLKALRLSLNEFNSANSDKLAQVLIEPNNILGIEYMKALLRLNSGIIPVTIQRISSGYHDTDLSEDIRTKHFSYAAEASYDMEAFKSDKSSANCKTPAISSATAVRRAINSSRDDGNSDLSDIEASVPVNVYELLKEEYLKSYPVTEEDFVQIIKYKLLAEDQQTLSKYLDITGDLADRMKNISDLNMSFAELAGKIKTKNMTLTRINRALIHLLLNIRTDAVSEYISGGVVPYARVLGIRKEASPLLRKIEKERQLPIITKVSKAERQLDDAGKRILSEDIFAAHLYNQAVYEKYRTVTLNEYKHGIYMI